MKVFHNGIKYINTYLPRTNHWLTLAASVPVALACGTMFAFSVYSTELADRCKLTTSQMANLNISTTVGSAIGGLFGGVVTDTYGTQLPILISCLSVFIGYKWLYELFNNGASSTILELEITMFLIGIGSTAGYFSAIKAVTMEFPQYKGTAQSITIASFAISSLIYLFICTHILKDDIGQFLNVIHISCGVMLFIGFLFIRVEGHVDRDLKYDTNAISHEAYDEASALLPSRSHPEHCSESQEIVHKKDLKSLTLKQSMAHPIFWYHFFMFSIIQGLGQMYIFTVGFILKAIYYYYNHNYTNNPDSITLTQLQALHVSLIAIFSFFGRLSSGPLSDILVNKLNCQRHWNLIIGLSVMLLGHLLNTLPLNHISQSLVGINVFILIISCLIGYAYGFSFTTYPAIISDIFSMNNYSFIWGLMYSSTTFGLTMMTKLFGTIFDSNSNTFDLHLGLYVCSKGSGCYSQTFSITSGLCIFVMILILGYIRYRVNS